MKRDRQIEKQAVIWKKSNNKKTSWFLKRKEARQIERWKDWVR